MWSKDLFDLFKQFKIVNTQHVQKIYFILYSTYSKDLFDSYLTCSKDLLLLFKQLKIINTWLFQKTYLVKRFAQRSDFYLTWSKFLLCSKSYFGFTQLVNLFKKSLGSSTCSKNLKLIPNLFNRLTRFILDLFINLLDFYSICSVTYSTSYQNYSILLD